MSPDDSRKQKNSPHSRPNIPHALEEILERLREGLDQVAQGLLPKEPQRVPVPVPARRPRRR